MYIRRCVLTECKLLYELGIYTGALCCIVKLPDEVCVSHTKRVGEIMHLSMSSPRGGGGGSGIGWGF